MGIVTEYYFDAFLNKATKTGQTVNQSWKESSIRDNLEEAYGFEHQRGERVELEGGDDTYEIVDRLPIYSGLSEQDIYIGDRLSENPDGNLTRSYDTTRITGEEIA